MIPQYNKHIFDVEDFDHGLYMALSPAGDLSPKDRAEKETPVLINMIKELNYANSGYIIDYGCGTGRLAKEMVALGYDVIGVDFSPSMRKLAIDYVDSPDHFLCVSPEMFDALISRGLKCSGAYMIWCLQHVEKPMEVIDRIAKALKPTNPLFICNASSQRFVPIKREKENPEDSSSAIIEDTFEDDKIDVFLMLEQRFSRGRKFTYPHDLGYDPAAVACYHYLKH